jgi:ubiquinone/menaquinone biosynthesis C-methylase UbiE
LVDRLVNKTQFILEVVMARNWTEAQEQERKFWDSIYVERSKDISTYQPITAEVAEAFVIKIMKNFNVDVASLSGVVVDLGCGPYGLVKGLVAIDARAAESHIEQIIGVDPLIEHYKTYGLFPDSPKVMLKAGQGEQIPLADQSADFLFCINVLDHVDRPAAVLREMRRVLKPGSCGYVEMHTVAAVLTPVKAGLKYVDKNHPHHFTEADVVRLVREVFSHCEVVTRHQLGDIHDFSWRQVMSSADKMRALKRFVAGHLLQSTYIKFK